MKERPDSFGTHSFTGVGGEDVEITFRIIDFDELIELGELEKNSTTNENIKHKLSLVTSMKVNGEEVKPNFRGREVIEVIGVVVPKLVPADEQKG